MPLELRNNARLPGLRRHLLADDQHPLVLVERNGIGLVEVLAVQVGEVRSVGAIPAEDAL